MKNLGTRYFLLIVAIVAVVLVFVMKDTIFQKSTTTDPTRPTRPTAAFTAYWPVGNLELNSYRLEQAKQGKLHPGSAVLIFSTDDFQTDKQAITRSPTERDKICRVLSLTRSRTFETNESPYTLSTVAFTPVANPDFYNTLKVSTSIQNWLTHSYVQLTYHKNDYQVDSRSYYDGDETYTIEAAMLEDELWNRIRLDPDRLPTGSVQLIPGTMSAQLRKKHIEPIAAQAQLTNYEGVLYPGTYLRAYTLQYPTDDRTLTIVFERLFPHKIVGWEETYRSQDNLLTSRAVLHKTIRIDNRNHKAPTDSTLQQLLLPSN